VDITLQKIAEENLRAVNKELEGFSYTVAHDLRTPLRSMHGYAEILKLDYGKVLDSEAERIINNIQQNASKMGKLIDNLLSFSRLGRKELQLTKIDMNKLTKDVLFELNASITHQANVSVTYLPEVMGDYGLLYQVMMNLISNAIKYSSKKETPIIRISSETKGGECIFAVKDNGAGFNMKYVAKLFGVFQRLHSEYEFEGTGIGLATVNRIIAKHGGRIWAEGAVDIGATFCFSLPQVK
ncbi:MAG TPA: ATP-binding protein, partial [Bacteroidia bacterium]|nr:ATP-binding protein [Bacteroidia bacterium]